MLVADNVSESLDPFVDRVKRVDTGVTDLYFGVEDDNTEGKVIDESNVLNIGADTEVNMCVELGVSGGGTSVE